MKVEKNLRRNSIKIKTTNLRDDQLKLLELTGNEYIGNFNFSVNIKKRNYLFFIAIAPSSLSYSDLYLVAFKKLSWCRFSNMDKDSFYVANMNFDIVIDHRISKALNNDSIYISLGENNLNTIPGIEEDETFHIYDKIKDKTFQQVEIINLIRGRIQKNNNKSSKPFSIGIAFYDCEKDDLDKIFSSTKFIDMVWMWEDGISIHDCLKN